MGHLSCVQAQLALSSEKASTFSTSVTIVSVYLVYLELSPCLLLLSKVDKNNNL